MGLSRRKSISNFSLILLGGTSRRSNHFGRTWYSRSNRNELMAPLLPLPVLSSISEPLFVNQAFDLSEAL